MIVIAAFVLTMMPAFALVEKPAETKTTYVAKGKALNNPDFGPGGYAQYYIDNYRDVLKPIKTFNLH